MGFTFLEIKLRGQRLWGSFQFVYILSFCELMKGFHESEYFKDLFMLKIRVYKETARDPKQLEAVKNDNKMTTRERLRCFVPRE